MDDNNNEQERENSSASRTIYREFLDRDPILLRKPESASSLPEKEVGFLLNCSRVSL